MTNKQLDDVLRHMAKHSDEIPLRPESIIKSSGLDIDYTLAYLICSKLYDDGYIAHVEPDCYVIKGAGSHFIKNMGYDKQNRRSESESWPKRHWFIMMLIGIGLGASIPEGIRWCTRKLSPKNLELKQSTLISTDTSLNNKPHQYPLDVTVFLPTHNLSDSFCFEELTKRSYP